MIRIALASMPFVNGDIQQNLHTMLAAMEQAAQAKAHMVCFGETFLQGFYSLNWDWKHDAALAVSQEDACIQRLRQASNQLGIDLAFGYVEKENDAAYSSFMVIQAGEILHNYRRITKNWKEYSITDEHYQEGAETNLFTYRSKRFTVALCGDLWLERERFCLGADVLLWPIYRDGWRDSEAEEYAQQCQGVAPMTCMVNSLCLPDGQGGAWLFENGQVKQQLAPGQEGLLLVEV